MYLCSPKINAHTLAHPYTRALWHTCMHTYTQAHWRPPLFTPRCICMQTAHSETIWSHSGGFARSVPSLGENIAGAEWKLHFAGANISLGLWKIPFKWSQAEKRQRICLAFCLTVFSAYTAVCFFFFRGYSTQEGPGNTDVEGGRAKGTHMLKYRTVWLSVCLSLWLVQFLLAMKHHVLHPWSFNWCVCVGFGLSGCCNTYCSLGVMTVTALSDMSDLLFLCCSIKYPV